MALEAHPAIRPITFLLGTWHGRGRGTYPSIDDFDYEEEARFWHVGKPFIAYAQKTWVPDTHAPLHSEMGFFRPQPEGSIEIVISHPFGYAEIQVGSLNGSTLMTRSTALVPTPSAKAISEVTRRISVEGDSLTYEVAMAAGGHELQGHLEATLERIGP